MKRPAGHQDDMYYAHHGQNNPNGYYGGYPAHPLPVYPKKSKFLAAVFSMMFPGTGHFYIGLFHKGLMFMMMFITNIILIIYYTEFIYYKNALPVILFAFLLPVIYLYNLFDCVHQLDALRRRQVREALEQPPLMQFGYTEQDKATALLFWIPLACLMLFLLVSGSDMLRNVFSWKFSYIGIVMLLTAGATMYLVGSRKR